MGSINFKRSQLLGSVGDTVGYKAGLALSQADMVAHAQDYSHVLDGSLDQYVRVHSDTYDGLVVHMLYQVGYLESDSTSPISLRLYAKYRHDPEASAIVHTLLESYVLCVRNLSEPPPDKRQGLLDPTPIIQSAFDRHGKAGLDMAAEFLDGVNRDIQASPHSPVRRIDWKDSLALDELFKSESIAPSHGTYIDQRFVDYLERNFESIDRINWRKFEALTSEYFVRRGYGVEIGRGRNDDGIDVRVWQVQREVGLIPPTILVQCKRSKAKVGKVVVKALWADVLDAKAVSGVVVTTSCLSPGAKRTRDARGYRIAEKTRSNLKVWLSTMRSPYSGVFLGE